MENNSFRAGLIYAFGAFSMWGLVPVYFKVLDQVPPLEVLGHRVVWSALLLVIVLMVSGNIKDLVVVFRSPRLMAFLALSSVLIAINWLCFIWGVTSNRILETSLGYYINPLVNVLFGFIFFGERLNRVQYIAVGLAAVAVCIQIVLLGKVPWVAFVLALSFGFYGLVRKKLDVKAAPGLAVETLLLLPFSMIYFFWLWKTDQNAFRVDDVDTSILLMMAGVITTVPLILFNLAAKRLRLTVIGIMQYLGPSISFVVGVTIYKEPLGQEQLMTFGLIWLALIIFTADSLLRQKKRIVNV